MKFGQIIMILLGSTFCCTSAKEKVKAAYWLQDTIPPDTIDSTLFTHLFCSFANLDPSGNSISIPEPSFSNFTSTVRVKNPSLKTLLSIGGGDADPLVFASMLASNSSRASFIASTISVARSNSFDGLDLAYLNPPTSSDMSNLGTLFSEWRVAVEAESESPLILTASVRYTSTDYPPFPAQLISVNLDWINVMAYDFTAPATWGDLNRTGPTASLYDPTTHVSGSDGVNAWIQSGVPGSKIVLSIPFYGYAWKLKDPEYHGYGAAAAGPAISEDGVVNFRAVEVFLEKKGAVEVFDSSYKGNYCYDVDTWISYDDVEAIAAKVEYVVRNGLLGYIAWQILGDDDAFTLSNTAAVSLTITNYPVLLGALCY